MSDLSAIANVRISQEELDEIDKLAERSRVSRSAVIRVLILDGLARLRRSKKKRVTL